MPVPAHLQLCCRLEPADIKLAPPTAEQFHADLQALFATGELCCCAFRAGKALVQVCSL